MSFVKLHHKLLKWGWVDEPNMVALWVRILLEANWKDDEWHGVVYERGSFPTSYSKLSVDTGLSIQTLRTCLKRLEKSGEITCEPTNGGTKIIVNKWDYYQGSSDETDIPTNTPVNTSPTRSQHEANIQPTTLKEYKNIRSIEVVELKNNKKFVKPSIEEVEAYCYERGGSVDPQRWYDFYESNGWKVGKNPMKDWKASVRNWERESYQTKKKGMVNVLDL